MSRRCRVVRRKNLTVNDEGPRARPRGHKTGRLEAFSDGVFSIAITLLVLELGVASGSEDDLLGALVNQWPSYLAYLVSFSTIGAVWFAHTVITECLDRATPVLVQLNLILLMVVALLPFPTRLLAEFIGEPNAERVATTVFGINLLLTAVLVWVLWRYAVHAQLVRPDMTDEDLKTLNKRLAPSLGAYVVMIVLGLFLPVVAVFGYLAIAVFILVPFRATRHRSSRT
ncbi:MAG: DUF1211 domain-containing protein [Rhodococcus sp. (in: high G+C Gram-positive bacteria)]|nr:MAG: DUF1211 domain-containing protein [Rhodococcus sp. (in: high G+C Gram-positive bacteria)]